MHPAKTAYVELKSGGVEAPGLRHPEGAHQCIVEGVHEVVAEAMSAAESHTGVARQVGLLAWVVL
jgi:hypothetical protein